MNVNKASKILIVLLIGVLALAGCGFNKPETSAPSPNESPGTSQPTDQTEPQENKEVKQVLNLVEGSDIPTLDSAKSHDLVSFTVLNNVNEGLYRSGPDHKPLLGMAMKHDISDDGLVHTFTLRDAKWSNGDPVTAYDFVYAWQRVFNEVGHYNTMFETASILNATEIINEEKPAEELGVKAIDEKTLEVTLSSPNPLLSTLLTFPTFLPLNQKFVESQGDQYALGHDKLLYNGPFMLTDWKQEQGWQYKKNPTYWDADAVKLEEINVYVVKDSGTDLNLFESGKVDRIALDASNVNLWEDSEDFTTIELYGVSFLRFNHENKALSNVNIRRAIGMAIDKEGFADVILNDGSKPLYGFVPYNFSFSPDGKDFREINGDFNKGAIEEARQLFAKGLAEIGETKIELNILGADTEGSRKTREFLKDQLETNLPGLTVVLKSVPGSQRLALERAVEYDISVSNWSPDYNDPMTYIDMWVTGGSANRMHYSNPKFDDLVAKANAESDMKRRYELLLEAERVLLEEDAAIVPLYQSAASLLQRKSIKGLVTHPTGARYSYKWVSIE